MAVTFGKCSVGPAQTLDGRERFNLLPNYADGKCKTFLYAMGCSDGYTKFGITTHPRKRIVSHMVKLRQREVGIDWVHIFRPYPQPLAYDIERRICLSMFSFGFPMRDREWFLGVNRDRALREVRFAAHVLSKGCT